MLRLDIPEDNDGKADEKTLEDFEVRDGDRIKISPILPYADKPCIWPGTWFDRENSLTGKA